MFTVGMVLQVVRKRRNHCIWRHPLPFVASINLNTEESVKNFQNPLHHAWCKSELSLSKTAVKRNLWQLQCNQIQGGPRSSSHCETL